MRPCSRTFAAFAQYYAELIQQYLLQGDRPPAPAQPIPQVRPDTDDGKARAGQAPAPPAEEGQAKRDEA